MKKIRGLLGLGLVLAMLLSACESLPFDLPGAQQPTPTLTPAPGSGGEMAPTPEMTTTAEATPEPVTELTVWVPPELDPTAETEASQLFAAQLALFSDLNNGLEIVVRVKATTGTGGLLDALTATSAAAPEALPDLIALSRPDLETAALKSLIYPLDGMTTLPNDADWYGFAREMALLQGSTFGLPYAADALVLAYRPEVLPEMPGSWDELIEQEQVLAFPADSDQALFTLALYRAEGGLIQDNQRRPVLELEPLSNVFGLFQAGVRAGALPDWLNQYQTPGQVWSSYREGQSNLAVTWLSNYLKDQPGDTNVTTLLPMSAGAVTLGGGMSWTVATAIPTRQALAVQLAEFLVQPEFLAEWTAAAGYIPPRPSALESWTDQGLRNTVDQVALMTRLRPTNDLISSLGPILREGTRQILQDLVDPGQAAQVAVDSLEE
ncbi:MAG: extracellular solute-binding protein [Chloroflexota bacterium]|nr:extracellular solute-binding protein [Chloroflexota bacterium]